MQTKNKMLTALGLVAALAATGYAASAYAHGSYGDRDERGWHEKRGEHRDEGRGGHMRGMANMFERYDANGDNALGIDELKAERAKQFKKFDANGDGVLDLTEYRALWMEAMNERMVDRFQKYDNDGDGKITEEDFSKRILRMMSWMDRNQDGKVDKDDRAGGDHRGMR